MRSRRICWPKPDATCLEGGCLFCNDHSYQTISRIQLYANTAGMVPNRGGDGTQDAAKAFAYGLANNFFGRVETR